jgi:hypothetical protein
MIIASPHATLYNLCLLQLCRWEDYHEMLLSKNLEGAGGGLLEGTIPALA